MRIKRFFENLFRQIWERIGRIFSLGAGSPVPEVVSLAELAEFKRLCIAYISAKSSNDSTAERNAKDSVEQALEDNPVLRSHLQPAIADDFDN